jgi:hypothetical protein
MEWLKTNLLPSPPVTSKGGGQLVRASAALRPEVVFGKALGAADLLASS